MIGDEDHRTLDAGALKPDRDVRIAVEVVQRVHRVGVGGPHTVDHHAQKVAAPHVHVAVEHHQREEVIGRAAHVAYEKNSNKQEYFHA